MNRFSVASVLVPFLVLLMVGCQEAPDIESQEPVALEFYSSDTMSNFPFSEAVRVGDLLFMSGQVGTKPDGSGLIEGGIGPETQQVMENIQATVEKYGSSMDNVAKCLVMLADITEWPAMNEVYKEFFPGNKPARSAFAGSGLALNARVEIECIAVIR